MSEARTSSKAAVYGALIGDTFEEARARWLFWGLFGLSTLLIVIFLFVLKVDLVEGAVSIMGRPARGRNFNQIDAFVKGAYSWVSIVLYIWGTFLAVFASSGLIPSVLEAGRISLLLSKPISRTTLLAGRYIGTLLVVAANHLYLICSIWIIIGLKTHIWEPRFLLAIPVSLFIFAVLLCAVVLIGVVTENAALSVMAAVALMLIGSILAQHQIAVRLLDSQWARNLWLALYWIVPKFYDLASAMKQSILYDKDADWIMPVWTTLAFGIIVLSGAIQVFKKRDF